jgi:AcrR family transcriptional regulator
MLYMSSARPAAAEDLTTRARIREAAVLRFAADGLQAPLRAIAADVGASPALILHHFRSRAGLRRECDQWVLAQISANKSAVLGPGGATAMLTQLAHVEGYAHLVAYLLRCLQSGGAIAKQLINDLAAESEAYLREAEETGTVSSSRDPAARARLLTEQALGALLLQLPGEGEQLDVGELPALLRAYTDRVILPYLELYTEPLLTDSGLLDAYLSTLHQPNRSSHA